MKIGVAHVFEKGMDQDEEIIGVHGTAWESVAILHETGFLPATLNKNMNREGIASNDHRDGCVYFFPLRKHFPSHKSSEYFPETIKNAIQAASVGYANRIGRELALMTYFDLDIHSPEIRDLADRATSQRPRKTESLSKFFQNRNSSDLYKIIKEKGFSEDEIRSAVIEASQREGIVLAIRKTIFDVFELHQDATDRESLAVVCPQGLSIEHICGIEPCGDYEYEKLENLKD